MRRALGGIVLVLSACSFVLQDVNEGAPPERPPTCSTSYTYPIIDGVIATAGGVGFGVSLDCSESASANACFGQVAAGIFLALPVAITFGLSAIYGITRRSRCERARTLWNEYVGAPKAPAFVPPASRPAPPPPPDAGPPPMK